MDLELLQSQQGILQEKLERLIPEVELLREYRRVELQLGRPPSLTEMASLGRFSISTYMRRYESWSSFRAEMGNPVEENRVTKEHLVEDYLAVKAKLARIPSGKELGVHGKYGVRTYHKYFGGHKKLLALPKRKVEPRS